MPTPPPPCTKDSREDRALSHLLIQLGAEVAAPLTQALERLHVLTAGAGAISTETLQALRTPLRRARDATLLAAQVGRLSGGRVVPAAERCVLPGVLRQVVEMRRREAQARGLNLRLDTVDTEVVADPALLPSLLHALLDWALTHTRSSIELTVSIAPWPPLARLQCRFAVQGLDEVGAPPPPTLNGLRWILTASTAHAMALAVERHDEAGVCVAQIDFPLWSQDRLPNLGAQAERRPEWQDTQPFAGWRALVVSADADFHRAIASVMQPMGWALDGQHSIDAGFQQCLEALPHAIVVDGALTGPDLRQWRSHVRADSPGYCFIEVGGGVSPGSPPSDAGFYCTLDEVARTLPSVLRAALAPRDETLTFRI